MKNKLLITLMAALIFMGGFSMTAYAGGGEGIPPEEPQATETPEPENTPNPVALTPDGNLTLVDDIEGEQAEDKQFITVVSKNGNYFYIVIDRAGDKKNVYFLNMVDEADLMAIIDELDKTPTPPVVTPQPTPEPEPVEPEPAPKNNTGTILIMVLLIAGAGGGAFYYFKILKPKQSVSDDDLMELDELNFDDGDDYIGGEDDSPVESDDEE